MATQPAWRRAFNSLERTVGSPLEQLIDTRRFAEVLVLAFRAQGLAYKLVERQTQTVLHLWNLPSRSDIKHISRQLTVLATEIRRVSELLDDTRPAPTPTARSARKPAAHKTPAPHG